MLPEQKEEGRAPPTKSGAQFEKRKFVFEFAEASESVKRRKSFEGAQESKVSNPRRRIFLSEKINFLDLREILNRQKVSLNCNAFQVTKAMSVNFFGTQDEIAGTVAFNSPAHFTPLYLSRSFPSNSEIISRAPSLGKSLLKKKSLQFLLFHRFEGKALKTFLNGGKSSTKKSSMKNVFLFSRENLGNE